MFCSKCGARVPEDALFCSECGVKLPADNSKYPTNENQLSDTQYTTSEQETSNVSNVGGELIKGFKELSFVKKVLVVIGILAAVFLIIFALWIIWSIISSPVALLITAILGFGIYHFWGANKITEHKYHEKIKELKELNFPDGMSSQYLLESLSGKFNYPYFKGIRYGDKGECVIDGRYSSYIVMLCNNSITKFEADFSAKNTTHRVIMLESIAICDYMIKFFKPYVPVDLVKDMQKIDTAEKYRKLSNAVYVTFNVIGVILAVVFFIDMLHPGTMQRLITPGAEVRSAYLSQYSESVTIEEAFDSYFENEKWSTYKTDEYSYVLFDGVCYYLNERADVKVRFKITGENFIVDSIDINGQTQGDLVMYALLSDIYENIEEQ